MSDSDSNIIIEVNQFEEMRENDMKFISVDDESDEVGIKCAEIYEENMGFIAIDGDTDDVVIKEEFEEDKIENYDCETFVEYIKNEESMHGIDFDNTTDFEGTDNAQNQNGHSLIFEQKLIDGVLKNTYQCLECGLYYDTLDDFTRTHHRMSPKTIIEDDVQSETGWIIDELNDDSLTNRTISKSDYKSGFAGKLCKTPVDADEGANDMREQMRTDCDILIKNDMNEDGDGDGDEAKDKYVCCDCRMVFNGFKSAEGHKCSPIHTDTAETEPQKNYEDHLKDFIETQNKKRKATELTMKSVPVKIITYNCNVCSKVFTSIQALNYHNRLHKGKLSKQVPEKPEPREVACPICNTTFDSNKNLKLHMKIHQKKVMRTIEEALPFGTKSEYRELNKFFCEICNKSFDQNLLPIHKNMHMKYMGEYTCKICNRHFENQLSYDMHVQMHTEQSKEVQKSPNIKDANNDSSNKKAKRFPCQYCDSSFTRAFEKVRHERVHTGEKPHSCEVCGKSFRVNYSLTLHLRTHTNVRPYVCPTCNKRFKSQPVYAHHLRTHQEERSYTCSECQKSFRTSVQLSAHRKIHSKPFPCPVCNRPFASLYAVKIHLKTHSKLENLHEDMRHTCNICGAIYGRISALRLHLKEIHSVDMAEQPELQDNSQSGNIEVDEIDGDNEAAEAAVLIAAATEAGSASYMDDSIAATSSQSNEVYRVILQHDEVILDNYETEEIVAE